MSKEEFLAMLDDQEIKEKIIQLVVNDAGLVSQVLSLASTEVYRHVSNDHRS